MLIVQKMSATLNLFVSQISNGLEILPLMEWKDDSAFKTKDSVCVSNTHTQNARYSDLIQLC